MVVLMKTKELDQFMCDWYPSGCQMSVDANWLQERLRELEESKRTVNMLRNRNEMLQSLSLLKELDCPEYRLNVRG